MSAVAGGGLIAGYEWVKIKAATYLPGSLYELFPDQASPWWIFWIVVAWILVSLAIKEAKQTSMEPRLIFDEPITELMKLDEYYRDSLGKVHTTGKLETIQLATINVRNNPINQRDGRSLDKAHCRVYFYNFYELEPFLKLRFPRWRENIKPRLDTISRDMPRAHYQSSENERTLQANNIPNGIDFVVHFPQRAETYGFHGAMQDSQWQDYTCEIKTNACRIKLEIEGAGMEGTAECWMVLNKSSGLITIESEISRLWMCGIGVG